MATGYVFRDDLAADKSNQQDLAMQGMAPPPAPTLDPNQSQAPSVSAPANPQANAFAGLAKTMQATAPKPPAMPAQDPNPFAQFSAALEAQNPFKDKIQQGVSQTLDNPYGAIDASNAAARDKAALEANAATEERRNQGITAYGGNATGQATRDLNRFQDNRLLNDQRFELGAAANREAAGEVARGNAVSQGLGLLGESRAGATTAAGLADSAASRASQEKISYAGLSIQDKQLTQQASQAKDELTFKRDALANGNDQASIDRAWNASQQAKELASREKISFAQLSLEEKKLVSQADQFTNELDFKKAALANGNDQASIDRAWNASQNADERAAREKIANAQIGSQERLQASQQVFQAAERQAQGVLDSMMQNDRIQAQFDLANLDNTFQEKLQKNGYLQTKDLQQMKQDFETSLTDKGIAADVAKQLSDQKFQMMKADNDHAFDASQNLLNQTWQSGERIDAQDWTSSLKTLEMKHDDLVQERDIAAKQGLQTQSIDAEIKKTQMQLASQELMASADLLQKDSQFQKEYMLKYNISDEEMKQSRIKLNDDLATSLINREGMGLQNSVVTQALKNDKVQNAMQLATWGMEIGDGSPEAMAPFVAQIGASLTKALAEQDPPVTLTAKQIENMITAGGGTTKTETGTGTTGAVGSVESNNNFKSFLTEASNAYSTKVDIDALDSIGTEMANPSIGNSIMGKVPDSYFALKSGNVVKGNQDLIPVNGVNSTQPQMQIKTQEGSDFYYMVRMIGQGLTENQAFDLAAKSVGTDRMKKAYKKLTGKDYGVSGVAQSALSGGSNKVVMA